MKARMRPTLLLTLCLALSAAPAFALRCGNKIVSEGDSTMALLHNCGEPTMKEQFQDRIPYRTFDSDRSEYRTEYASQPYEVWTYNFGPRRFIQRITLRGGKIDRIESQGYGY